MIEGGFSVFIKWVMAPISAVAGVIWWFFKRHQDEIRNDITENHRRTDLIERRVAHLEKNEAAMIAKLEYLIDTSKDTRRLLEKLDDKLDNK